MSSKTQSSPSASFSKRAAENGRAPGGETSTPSRKSSGNWPPLPQADSPVKRPLDSVKRSLDSPRNKSGKNPAQNLNDSPSSAAAHYPAPIHAPSPPPSRDGTRLGVRRVSRELEWSPQQVKLGWTLQEVCMARFVLFCFICWRNDIFEVVLCVKCTYAPLDK
jgi:hypothetical protein